MVSCLESQTRLGPLFLALYPLRTRWGQLEHISDTANFSFRLQTDVQSHFVFVRKLLSAKSSFEVVRIRSCACACAQVPGTVLCTPAMVVERRYLKYLR